MSLEREDAGVDVETEVKNKKSSSVEFQRKLKKNSIESDAKSCASKESTDALDGPRRAVRVSRTHGGASSHRLSSRSRSVSERSDGKDQEDTLSHTRARKKRVERHGDTRDDVASRPRDESRRKEGSRGERVSHHSKHLYGSSDDENSVHRFKSSETAEGRAVSRRYSSGDRRYRSRRSSSRVHHADRRRGSRSSLDHSSLRYYSSSRRSSCDRAYRGRSSRRSPSGYTSSGRSMSRPRYRGSHVKKAPSVSRSRRRSGERHGYRSTSSKSLCKRPKRHSSCSKSPRHSLSSGSSHQRNRSREGTKKTRHHSKELRKRSPAQETAKPTKKSKWDVPLAASADLDGKIGLLAVDPNRRLYITNLPPDILDSSLVHFLNGALIAASGVDFTTAALTGFFPVSKVQLVSDQHYAIVDLRTVSDVNICLQLDGILFNGNALKISRSTDIVLPKPPEEARVTESAGSVSGGSSEVKVYVTDLPVTVTDQELRVICSRYGRVRSVALMKDLKTSQSMGCGVVEFETPVGANAAVKALDRKPMGLKIPRFHKGLVLPGLSRLSETGERLAHTSAVVTELPTSVTYKIFSNAIVGAQVRASRQEGAKPSLVVQLLNAVFPEDLIKDDEYKAIVEDMRNEASQYGTLVNVVIPRPPEDLSFKPGVGKVFMHFSDITAARRAQAELNGRRYDQRRTICAAFYNLDRFLQGKYTLV